MAGASTSSTSSSNILQHSATTQNGDSDLEHEIEQVDEQRCQGQGPRGPSAYVDVFESMVMTVLEHEHALLSDQEIDALDNFRKFCYNTRYCLIRLILRKPNQWHAISALRKFEKEVGEEGLLSSIADLCQPISPVDTSQSNEFVVPDVLVKTEDDTREIIDLISDSEEEEDHKPVKQECLPPIFAYNAEAGPSRLPTVPPDPVKAVLESNPAEMNLGFFCEDESSMTLEDILWRLNKDQLLELVKSTRCKLHPRPKKVDIIASLQRTAASQYVLSPIREAKGKAKGRNDGLRQGTFQFLSIRKASRAGKHKMTQEHRLRQMALKLLGKCVRVNFDFYRLVRRINIVCYREKEYPTSLMLPALLTVFKKRNYPPYQHTRDSNIWTSRDDLLEYEKALEAEKALEQIMETPADTSGRRTTRTPGYRRDEFITPVPTRAFTTPLVTPGSIADVGPRTPRTKKEEEPDQTYLGVTEPEVETEEQKVTDIPKDQKMVNCLNESIFPKWRELLSIREAQECQSRSAALERFETGYVYTRMIDKAAHSFGPLKMYDDELIILNCLLGQKYWSRGKRARWYVRRAIIQNHLWSRYKDEKLLLKSIEGIREALSDEDTGIVWRPNLELRLNKLEKKLRIPEADRFNGVSELQKPRTIEVRAVRVYPTKFDLHGRPINDEENPLEAGLHAYMSVTKKDLSEEKKPETPKPVKKVLGQKSSWQGRGSQIVNVETRALEHYEDLGFQGFHCETRILTTLFALLFWDVMFANIPGALETPFQDAPLDLCEDTFYYARKDLIEARLAEISDGKAPEILQRHDEQYREKETWCVGLSWDLCGREDLVDIVKCLGGKSLSTICKLFCEDYKGRRSGGPDLFIWKAEQRLCKFVEVKGPGDTPQENQKLWFDGLLRANAAVEICKVIDVATDNNPIRGKKRKAKTPGSSSRKKRNVQLLDSNSEEENYDKLDLKQELESYGDVGLNRPEKRPRLPSL